LNALNERNAVVLSEVETMKQAGRQYAAQTNSQMANDTVPPEALKRLMETLYTSIKANVGDSDVYDGGQVLRKLKEVFTSHIASSQ
jgi:hypothetical protein